MAGEGPPLRTRMRLEERLDDVLDGIPRVRTPLLLALLLLAVAAPPVEAAPVTRSCELLPHGALAGANVTGCSVAGDVTQSIHAVVSVTAGTVDAIEIEMTGSAGQRHVFVCSFAVAVSTCILPVQENGVAGSWTVRARIVAADPLGPVLFGGADTYARLDATFA